MKIFAISFFLLCCSICQSQKQGQDFIDSLLVKVPMARSDLQKILLYNNLSYGYANIDPELGIIYGKKAILISEKIGNKSGLSEAYRCTGISISQTSDFKTALIYYGKALEVAQSVKDNGLQSKIYKNIGLAYTLQGRYPEGLKYSSLALKLSESLGNQKEIAGNLSNIGIIYNDLQDYEKSAQYYNKAREINEKSNNEDYLISNYGNLGGVYGHLNERKKAAMYFQKAISLAVKIGDKSAECTFCSNIGYDFLAEENYDQAMLYFNRALRIAREIGKKNIVAFNLGNIGETFSIIAKNSKPVDIKKLREAAVYLQEAIKLDKEIDDWERLQKDLLCLSEIQQLLGNSAQALLNLQQSNVYKDSIYNYDNKQTIKNLEDQRVIERTEKELQFNKLKVDLNEKQRWYYITGIISLFVIGLFVYRQSLIRKSNNRKLQLLNAQLDQANNVKTRFFSILNHDLRAPVSSLIHFLHLQKEAPELMSSADKIRLENKTISSTENLLQSMEDLLLWSKGQMVHFQPKMATVSVAGLFSDLEKHFSGEERVSLLFENSQNLILHTDENYLKTIMRNLTGNAIKALGETKSATVIWKAWSDDRRSYLSITDNGPGGSNDAFKALYDDTEVVGIKTGLGLHLVRDLALAINCTITVDSKLGKTVFTICCT